MEFCTNLKLRPVTLDTHLYYTNEWITYDKPNVFKSNVKFHLPIDAQFHSAKDEWTPENFPLHQTIGLRNSDRLRAKKQINYAE